MGMVTFQDFEKHVTDRAKWLGQVIAQYKRSDEYLLALDADQYEKQENVTINNFVKMVYDITGQAHEDFTSTNHRIASNFFHRLNTQRCTYLLGNGVSFANRKEEVNAEGKTITTDTTKNDLGKRFDDILFKAGYYALIHGVCYVYDNDFDYYVFPMTEFMPFRDEETGAIRAGVRFWSLDWKKRPIIVDLYEEDGYSRYKTKPGKYGLGALEEIEPKRPYKERIQTTEADGDEIVGGDNYPSLPIVDYYGTKAKQSTLVGMRANIDAYDLIHSGFANDETDCAQVYWLINNAAGMDDDDVAKLRDRIMLQHIAVVDTTNSGITPYTQEIPYNSREACLNRIKNSIYRDFGGFDVENISATNASITATQINAAYQPMDEEADDFEYQTTEFIKKILFLHGIEDSPIFVRNRIVNQLEQTQMVMLAANYLDDETVLSKLPWITVDERDMVMLRKTQEDQDFLETNSNMEE